jgi:DNA-binding transcriptional MocR family regulator
MSELEKLKQRYAEIQNLGLELNIERGQPSDENFDLANPMLTILDENNLTTPSGVAIRNYPGGPAGLKEARQLFSEVIGVRPEETIVGNNASLRLMSNILMWALIKGLQMSTAPWSKGTAKIIVTVPGYDRHFLLLEKLGFEQIPVQMLPDGPDIGAIEKIDRDEASVKGIFFVPTYSNPTGEVVSDEVVNRLASMKTAAPDFTIFADDAYAVHHLTDEYQKPKNLLRACEEAGNPDRVYIFGSTSKITFSGGGIGFFGTSTDNVAFVTKLMGYQSIGPNKLEQYRHVLFLTQFPGGIPGLMREHAKILKPKFDAVQKVLKKELDGAGLATWTNPKGGYFVSLNTSKPVADKVVSLAKQAGVSLTPAGATYPFGKDPNNTNIRISPTRPPVEEVEKAMEVVALCVKLASA